ncbi:hypothetical protein RIF29_25155 [Crotalaria pallida]|uniref:Uncharacterized protein n=1 Tax=Crotalaria pallida TaxID=3830 RepID=A0AAN9ENH5_CROPI
MPKKRGRPPKSPLSSSKTIINEPKIETITPSKDGISHLDEEDLEDIENLSPKQAPLWIQKIDALREKIRAKSGKTYDKEVPTMADPKMLSGEKSPLNGPDTFNVDRAKEVVKAVLTAATDTIQKEKEVNVGNHEESQHMPGVSSVSKQKESQTEVTEEDFKNVVQASWVENVEGSDMYQVCKKLQKLQKHLSDLNRKYYARIDEQELALKSQLDNV